MTTDNIQIRTALISVYHKDEKLRQIIDFLAKAGTQIISTGGTQQTIRQWGYECTAVEQLTSYPSILGGRVKTLHPAIFGAILARQDNTSDQQDCQQYNIHPLDLVIVDLYPFAQTVAQKAPHDQIIEKIDIGGISLIRAAAKNYRHVAIISDTTQYDQLLETLRQGPYTTAQQRQQWACQAFAHTAHYDHQIHDYLDSITTEQGNIDTVCNDADTTALRYGENPHQRGYYKGDLGKTLQQLHGKELSYNNILDIDAATQLIGEFDADTPTFAIIKHNNPCGLAGRDTALQAWQDALAGDPVSAFGGIIITNATVDGDTAQQINQIFFEAIVAPDYTEQALDILRQKKNRIILRQLQPNRPQRTLRSALGGTLIQDADNHTDQAEDLSIVTTQQPTPQQIDDMLFASKIVKHCRSNAIAIARDRQLIAVGIGQTSRIDALRQAIAKAHSFELPTQGAAMASDAFFPFGDCVDTAAQAGITAIIQPGGSIRDQQSVDNANLHHITMATTGIRHFRH